MIGHTVRNIFEAFKADLKRYAPGRWNPIAVREAHALFTFVLTLPLAVFYFMKMMSHCQFSEYSFFSRLYQYIHLFLYFSAIAIVRLLIGIMMRTTPLGSNLVIDYVDEDSKFTSVSSILHKEEKDAKPTSPKPNKTPIDGKRSMTTKKSN